MIATLLLKGAEGEIYNISNDKSVASIAEVAKTCASIAGTNVVYEIPDEVEIKGFSKPQDCILDNTKLEKLGWKGQYSLVEGLQETIECLEQMK